uniref:Protein CHUP1, chloroplastic n=1 Tax=Caenorhabditis tropicalis TaxID=1561998 RepID=A0A1I7U228_9PELO
MAPPIARRGAEDGRKRKLWWTWSSERKKPLIIKKLREDPKVPGEKQMESEASNESKLKESEHREKALESRVKALKREVTLQEIWINDTAVPKDLPVNQRSRSFGSKKGAGEDGSRSPETPKGFQSSGKKRMESQASNESKLKESELRGKALESRVKALKREVTLQEIWINNTAVPKDLPSTTDLGALNRDKTPIKLVLTALVDESIASREKSKIIKTLKDLKVSKEKRLDSEASNESKLKESELRGKALESRVKVLKREVTLQEIWINDTEWAGKIARDEKVALEQFIAMQPAASNKIISQLEMKNGYLKEKLREAMANEERFWNVEEVKEEMVEGEESKAQRKRRCGDTGEWMGSEKKRREG